MRSLRIAAVVGFIVLLNLGAGLYFARLPRPKTPVPADEVKITAWVRDPALADLLRVCEHRSAGVTLDIRLFRTEALLQQALVAAMTANHPPHIAEVTSHSGVPLNPGTFIDLHEHLSSDMWDAMHPAMLSYFTDGDEPWAVPYGASVPVLFYNAVLLSHTTLPMEDIRASWDAVRAVGQNVQAFGRRRNRDYQGLVVDREVLWYWENMRLGFSGEGESRQAAPVEVGGSQPTGGAGEGETGHAVFAEGVESQRAVYEPVFKLWRAMIFDDGIMPGLEQHRGLTDFVAGRAAFLMASSDKYPLLARHIGGRFSFGAIPLPGVAEAIPKVYALVAFASSVEADRAVAACLAYVTSPEVQQRVWVDGGKIPARTESMQGLAASGSGSGAGQGGGSAHGAMAGGPSTLLLDERLGGFPLTFLPASHRLNLAVTPEEGERMLERLELSEAVSVEDVWLP